MLAAPLLACPSEGFPPLVTGRAVPSSSSAPEIRAVHDIGSPSLIGARRIPEGNSDGVASIGELVLISGDNFGRSPRVSIVGRVAEQVARTADGGIVVRIPQGIRTGGRAIEVRNAHGKSNTTFPIRRYTLATVPSDDKVHVFEVTAEKLKRIGAPLTFKSAHLIRFCAGGQIALVSGRGEEGALVVSHLDMAAAGGPSRLGQQELPGKHMVALAAAEQVPVAVALSDSHLMFYDTRDPRGPTHFKPQPLPPELKGELVAADMNPKGTLLAALVSKANKVVLYDVTKPNTLRKLTETAVLPIGFAPLLKDLRFSIDSKTLWVLSGDNPRSRKLGRFPLRLTALKIEMQQRGRAKSYGVLSVWRALDVPHQAAPVALTVAKGQPVASGATVAIPPANAAIFITVHDAKLLKLAKTPMDQRWGMQHVVKTLSGIDQLGTLVKTDINGKGGPVFTSPYLLGSLDLTSDSQMLVLTGARVVTQRRPAKVKLIYGVASTRVFGAKGDPPFIELATLDDPKNIARPFLLGDVRIQP
jgi:hypothetical protein